MRTYPLARRSDISPAKLAELRTMRDLLSELIDFAAIDDVRREDLSDVLFWDDVRSWPSWPLRRHQ